MSAELLSARAAAARAELLGELARPLAPPPLLDVARRRLLTTGVGVSEGPARCLATLLQEAGLCAAFRPLSCFVDGPPAGVWDTLVLFSQGLSPNARLCLRRRHAFRHVLLVTSQGQDGPAARLLDELRAEGAWVHRHPPAEEGDILLRVVGPALASLAALRLAAALARAAGVEVAIGLEGLAEALAGAPAQAAQLGPPAEIAALLEGPVALVSCAEYGELCHGLRWKLLEGLWIREPPHWDLLQVAHGPFQQFWNGPLLLLGLERPGEAALWERLAQVLEPARHRLLRLRSPLAGPAALLVHDALCNELLLPVLRERPRDLARWPGQGRDGALYDFTGE